MYDVIIIGAGPAGLSAGIYAIRAGLSSLILDKTAWGGQTILSAEIENYPAIPSVNGPDFAEMMYDQLTRLGGGIALEEVNSVDFSHRIKKVVTKNAEYEAKTAIVATGLRHRELNCKGEEEFAGRGVSYCAICDGRFFAGRDVAVIGGGNTAMEDALHMSTYCRKIYLVCRGDKLKGEDALKKGISKKQNIQVIFNSEVMEISGENQVEALTLHNGERLNLNGVFVAIGYQADSGFLQGQIELNEQGYVIAGENCKTNLPGVYIAGDLRTKEVRQIVTAAADGATAALGAADFILRM